jgi:hypothetical protein
VTRISSRDCVLFRKISNEPCILNCSQMVLRPKVDTDQNNDDAVFCADRNISYCQFYFRFQSTKFTFGLDTNSIIIHPHIHVQSEISAYALPTSCRTTSPPDFQFLTFASRGYITQCVGRGNLLKPTGNVMHHQFNIQQLYALPTLYLCFVFN